MIPTWCWVLLFLFYLISTIIFTTPVILCETNLTLRIVIYFFLLFNFYYNFNCISSFVWYQPDVESCCFVSPSWKLAVCNPPAFRRHQATILQISTSLSRGPPPWSFLPFVLKKIYCFTKTLGNVKDFFKYKNKYYYFKKGVLKR